MGLAALVAGVVLAAASQDPAPVPPAEAVTLPPVLSAKPSIPDVPEAAPAADAAPARPAIPAEEPRRPSRPLEDNRPEPGPGIAGFLVGSFAVLGLLGGAFLLLRRFGKNSRLLAGAGAIKVLARKPLTPKQEIFLVEVGTKVFMIGSTRDHLSTLGEISAPDEVAVLRANLPERKDDSLRREFQQSLRDGLRGAEGSPAGSPAREPREERVFASIADELAEIRKTVRAWRA